MHTRLNLYKRLATAEKPEQIDGLLEEITDRFGKLPAQGQTLFDTHRLRVQAKPYGVVKIDATGLLCPLPVLRAQKALRGMAAGEVIDASAVTGNNYRIDFAQVAGAMQYTVINTTTGAAVDCMPTAKPAMMFVAWPVSLAFEMYFTGSYSFDV